MVSINEGAHLSVIEGMKGKDGCTGECNHDTGRTGPKEPLATQNPQETGRYDMALKQLQLAKLAHEHRKLRMELENQQRDLDFALTLEKLTFEASLDGVPVRHITDSHDQAFEALEAAQQRVA
jgi:hypothetical protein